MSHRTDASPTRRAEFDAADAGVALRKHPLVTLAWILAALVVAVGLGPWISRAYDVFLPAFAMVRLGRPRPRD